MTQAIQRHSAVNSQCISWPRLAGKHTLAEVAGDYVREAYNAAKQSGDVMDKNDLLIDVAQFLQNQFFISDQAAQIAAAQAIGFYLSWGNSVSFDMNHSSSHTVFLRDSSTGRLHCITADELAKILANRSTHLV